MPGWITGAVQGVHTQEASGGPVAEATASSHEGASHSDLCPTTKMSFLMQKQQQQNKNKTSKQKNTSSKFSWSLESMAVVPKPGGTSEPSGHDSTSKPSETGILRGGQTQKGNFNLYFTFQVLQLLESEESISL